MLWMIWQAIYDMPYTSDVLEKCKVKDMCFMHDGPSKPQLRANTGFWFMRSSKATLEFVANTVAVRPGVKQRRCLVAYSVMLR